MTGPEDEDDLGTAGRIAGAILWRFKSLYDVAVRRAKQRKADK